MLESPCECGIEPPGSIRHGVSTMLSFTVGVLSKFQQVNLQEREVLEKSASILPQVNPVIVLTPGNVSKHGDLCQATSRALDLDLALSTAKTICFKLV